MKSLFRGFAILVNIVTLGLTVWVLTTFPSLPWGGVALMSAAPLLQRVFDFDSLVGIHHKVRLPRVSLAVLLGMGWVLATTDSGSDPLWLALINLGTFLLDTYWARDQSFPPG